MVVVDTSAWIELFRGSGHRCARSLRDLIDSDSDVAITEVVAMELLAGVNASKVHQLRRSLYRFDVLPLKGLAGFEEAALLYRLCRQAGETPRSTVDCLIAVAAINASAELLHNDSDFEKIARHTDLRLFEH